jgi:hypothetical protein
MTIRVEVTLRVEDFRSSKLNRIKSTLARLHSQSACVLPPGSRARGLAAWRPLRQLWARAPCCNGPILHAATPRTRASATRCRACRFSLGDASAGYRPATLPLDSLVGSLAARPIASLGSPPKVSSVHPRARRDPRRHRGARNADRLRRRTRRAI